jgi:hypothetical protein
MPSLFQPCRNHDQTFLQTIAELLAVGLLSAMIGDESQTTIVK